MKKINYPFLLSCFMALFLFASCASTRYGAHFQPSRYQPHAYENEAKPAAEELHAQQEDAAAAPLAEAARRSGAADVRADGLPSARNLKELMALEMPDAGELTVEQQEVLAATRERLKNMSREEKRALKREIRNIKLGEYTKELPSYAKDMDVMQESDVSENLLILVILAIFIPPLAVFLHQGEINNKFWLSLLLTILGYLPGQIYSLLLVLGIID